MLFNHSVEAVYMIQCVLQRELRIATVKKLCRSGVFQCTRAWLKQLSVGCGILRVLVLGVKTVLNHLTSHSVLYSIRTHIQHMAETKWDLGLL